MPQPHCNPGPNPGPDPVASRLREWWPAFLAVQVSAILPSNMNPYESGGIRAGAVAYSGTAYARSGRVQLRAPGRRGGPAAGK